MEEEEEEEEEAGGWNMKRLKNSDHSQTAVQSYVPNFSSTLLSLSGL